MSGYYGYSMSNNAVEAYMRGEKPISRWTKAEILEAVSEIDADKAILLKKVPLHALKKHFLVRTSWHHTSLLYNETDFYSIDEGAVETLTPELVQMYQQEVKPKAEIQTFRGDIHFLEWYGTRRHPRTTEKVLADVNIKRRGMFYYVSDDNGTCLLKKKIDSNGTWIDKKH